MGEAAATERDARPFRSRGSSLVQVFRLVGNDAKVRAMLEAARSLIRRISFMTRVIIEHSFAQVHGT